MKLYSIYDEKALCYGNPTPFATDGLALRAFSELVTNPDSNVNKYPGDFKIYFIGTFDDLTGALEPSVPVYLANGSQYAFNSCSKTDS